MKFVVNARFLTQNLSGVQRFGIEISKELRKICDNAGFVSPKNILHHDIAGILGARTAGFLKGHMWEQIELPLYLRANKSPLLLNTGNSLPAAYKKSMVIVHDVSPVRNPGWFSKKYSAYHNFMLKKLVPNALKIVTVSEFSKREIIELLNIPENKIDVVYNSVSNEFKQAAGEAVREKREKYALAISPLNPRKNFKNMMLAFEKLGHRDLKLYITGSFNNIYADAEIKRIMGSDRIVFKGQLGDKELAHLYKNAEFLIYPSLYEGFGIPPLEAMACGCPVVASNIGSLTEVCSDAAYYVDPYDVNDIAAGMSEILSNTPLTRELAQKGKQRVEYFNWENSASRLNGIIEKML